MDPQLQLNSGRLPGRAIAFLARLSRTYTLPACLIIGAQKAGTTSLASYLGAHPCVVSPSYKEVHFFDVNYGMGVEWYRSHFPIGARRLLGSHLQGRKLIAVDATPYYILHPQVPLRASQLISAARIIVLLRDPVDRAYSHYCHEVRLGAEKLPFEQAIDAECSRTAGEAQRLRNEVLYESFNYQHFTYLERGDYANQLGGWLNYFPPEQFLVLSAEQFFENPAVEYRKVLKFLGLPAWELRSYPAEHVGKYPPMLSSIREHLRLFYAPRNRALKDYLNSNWPGSGDAIVRRFST
jgi:hypothetical protein